MVETVGVALGARSYEVRVGTGLLARAGAEIAPLLRRPKVAVVTDETVAATHLMRLSEAFDTAGIAMTALALPPGEGTKGWTQLARTVEWMLDQKVERRDVVVAFGGGVVGDLVGFAAAILRRGVRFVQLPTTLLAQVDSSVGGKTGINAPQGKNLIGAFHQPRLVLADLAALDTLPARELLSGYAEVAKYGLLGDADFFAWLELHGPAIRAGDRALLNLGHTFGHALEAATGFSERLLHGDAVAIGCQLAFDLSARLGLCPQEAPSRLGAHLAAMGMKRRPSEIPGALPGAEALIGLMGQDKKVRDGRVAFVLARDIGTAFVARDVDLAPIRALLAEALAERQG
jgi:3-dehydroquinate synthase